MSKVSYFSEYPMNPTDYYLGKKKKKTLYIPSVISEINYIKSIEILAICVFSIFLLFFCLLNLNLFNWRLITLKIYFPDKMASI